MDGKRVDVRWLDVESIAADQWPVLDALLDESERRRAARFHFERDRLSYVAAHALGRRMLSEWAGGAPQDWRFSPGEHGKPEVVCPAGAPRLRLNLSHTRGLAAAALAVDHDVGVDVEWLGRQTECLALGERFFAAAECELLRRAEPDRLTQTFLSLWTLKEAYVKAIGKGLAQPLDSFSFTLEPPAIVFADPLADDPARWLFRQWHLGDGHLMALALRHPRPDEVTVSMRAMDACYPGPGNISRR